MQLEGQARASVRGIASELRRIRRLNWVAGGISATHHTAGRIDADHVQVRRAICWNDQTLADVSRHRPGAARRPGEGARADRRPVGDPLQPQPPRQGRGEADRGGLAAYRPYPAARLPRRRLPDGQVRQCSVSSAASTGIMDLRTDRWRTGCSTRWSGRSTATWPQRTCRRSSITSSRSAGSRSQLRSKRVCRTACGHGSSRPPTTSKPAWSAAARSTPDRWPSSSATRRSSIRRRASCPATDALDVMRLNWGPYLWMRCYNNGAQFLDRVVGREPDWAKLEEAARRAGRLGWEHGAAVPRCRAVDGRHGETLRPGCRHVPRKSASSTGPRSRRWRT